MATDHSVEGKTNRTVDALRKSVPHYYPVDNVREGLKRSPQRRTLGGSSEYAPPSEGSAPHRGVGPERSGLLNGRPAAFPLALGAWFGGPTPFLPGIRQARCTYGNLFRGFVGSFHVVVAMARGKPGDCRSDDDDISGGVCRGNLR